MCGIAGYYGNGDENILSRMNDTLRHRGPDDAGTYVSHKIGLAHRRLSIIDLSPAGHQPMANEDGTIQVVFNGEIYNFQDLKNELKQKHTFRGHSDTEIIIHLYEEIGVKVFSRLQGMFAIALYDTKKGKLYLVRDRMGKKPLYWTLCEHTLIFGSELKSILAHSSYKKEIDADSLRKYMLYEYVPTPHSILKGVNKLEPGTCLEYDGQSVTKNQFWDVTFSQSNLSFGDALKTFDEKLNSAVARRMVSDVPLGVLLSGGLDSSTVAYYAQKNSQRKIKTFSIGFTEKSFDESAHARKVANFLGTEHSELILTESESLNLIPSIASILDEPLADASLVPTYLLSKFTREHVTVALGGDGGDELMCGYDTFVAHRLAIAYEQIPRFLRRMAEPILLNLPVSHNNLTLEFKAKKFITGYYGEPSQRNQRWLGAFGAEEQNQLFTQHVLAASNEHRLFEDVDRYEENVANESYWNRLIYSYIRTYLLDDILVKVDRASMAASLEVRAPLLDTDIVDFLNSLPVSYKFKGLTPKYILKKLMETKLPKEIVHRKKKGFGMPVSAWLTGPLKPLMLDLLNEESLKKQGLFNPAYVQNLINEHLEKMRDNRKFLWTLMIFQMWWNKWYK